MDNDRIMAFSEDQVRKLLDSPNKTTFIGFRDYVIMMVLLDTGLRIGELFSLKKSDVDFEQLIINSTMGKSKDT